MAGLFDSLLGSQRVEIETEDVVFTIDATPQEQHTSNITLTTNPVEKGADIVDHAIDNPDKLTLDIVVSDDPITLFAVSGSLSRLFLNAERNSISAYSFFISLMENKTLINVYTTLRYYQNMILTEMTTPRSAAQRNGLFSTLTFEAVKIVSSEEAEIDEATDSNTTDRVQKTKGEGKVQTSPTDTGAANKSWAVSLFGG